MNCGTKSTILVGPCSPIEISLVDMGPNSPSSPFRTVMSLLLLL
jgi:hypothetical protein